MLGRPTAKSTELALTAPHSAFDSLTEGMKREGQFTRGWCHMKFSSCRLHRWVSCIALVMFGLFAACTDNGDEAAAPGAASVSLTDTPDCGYEVVNVTVSKVRIHQSGSANDNDAGWSEIALNPPRTINLLHLNDPTQPNFALEHLGETPLPAGHYTQLRLVLEDNNGNQPTANWI